MSDSSQSNATTSERNYETDEEDAVAVAEDVEDDDAGMAEIEQNVLATNEKLFGRLRALQGTMSQLKAQLLQERELWQKEVDEMASLGDAAADVFDGDDFAESVASADNELQGSAAGGGEGVAKEYTITEYEQKLARYQEALARAQAEKRASLQRQIAISNYKRRLLEVENMCNMELLRVKQNVQFLQPLQLIASEWGKEVQDHGDEEPPRRDQEKDGAVAEARAKDLVPAEAIGNRLYSEMNEMFCKISTRCFGASLVNMSSTTSTATWRAEDELSAVGKSQPTLWYPMS